jgi:hypothetical protein
MYAITNRCHNECCSRTSYVRSSIPHPILCFSNRALWYVYVIKTNNIITHNKIKTLIKSVLFAYCFPTLITITTSNSVTWYCGLMIRYALISFVQNFQNSSRNLKLPGATRVKCNEVHNADVATATGRTGERDIWTCDVNGVLVVNVTCGTGTIINKLRMCGNVFTAFSLFCFSKNRSVRPSVTWLYILQ